jgi:hypothetical protein
VTRQQGLDEATAEEMGMMAEMAKYRQAQADLQYRKDATLLGALKSSQFLVH